MSKYSSQYITMLTTWNLKFACRPPLPFPLHHILFNRVVQAIMYDVIHCSVRNSNKNGNVVLHTDLKTLKKSTPSYISLWFKINTLSSLSPTTYETDMASLANLNYTVTCNSDNQSGYTENMLLCWRLDTILLFCYLI